MHCILTTDGDACVLQFGPLNDDVNNFVIEAQGYNERTNQSKLIHQSTLTRSIFVVFGCEKREEN